MSLFSLFKPAFFLFVWSVTSLLPRMSVGWLVGRSVGCSVSHNFCKLHFHAPIGGLVSSQLWGLSISALHWAGSTICVGVVFPDPMTSFLLNMRVELPPEMKCVAVLHIFLNYFIQIYIIKACMSIFHLDLSLKQFAFYILYALCQRPLMIRKSKKL